MRAVSDAGPLIHLSWIDQVDLLERIFEERLDRAEAALEALDSGIFL